MRKSGTVPPRHPPTRRAAVAVCGNITMEDRFVQQRHKPPVPLERPRELIVACPPMRSNVNLSHIARTAGCFAAARMVCCGTAKLIDKITRSDEETLPIEMHRTLTPVLQGLRGEGYELVGLEQTTHSTPLSAFRFRRRTVLVVGNERLGLETDVLELLDHVVEIPVYGRPFSHNAATAAAMALYEYCRQFPRG